VQIVTRAMSKFTFDALRIHFHPARTIAIDNPFNKRLPRTSIARSPPANRCPLMHRDRGDSV
jgi:hypothetical protein